jgi:hypothetical protein
MTEKHIINTDYCKMTEKHIINKNYFNIHDINTQRPNQNCPNQFPNCSPMHGGGKP